MECLGGLSLFGVSDPLGRDGNLSGKSGDDGGAGWECGWDE